MIGTTLVESSPAYARLQRTQYWSAGRLEAYRNARLEQTLRDASGFAFYRSLWNGSAEGRDFAALPVLTRVGTRELLAEARSRARRAESDRSSGSTGMPAEFLFDRAHQRVRYAARARYLLEHGWRPWSRTGWIIYLPRGVPHGRIAESRLFVGSRFLSVFTPVEKQVEWLKRLDPLFLYTFPSNLDGLLAVLGEKRASLPSLRKIYCGSEVVDPALRERTRRALGVEIAENYGSTEAFLAWECREGRLHVNAEHVFVEIVDEAGRPAEAGVLGRVLVTTLQNGIMPLVRYEIGDWALAADGPCPCGRTLPLLGRVAGRAVSLFRTTTGRVVTPWDIVVRIKYRNDMRQFQIVQKTTERCVLRYIAPGELSAPARAEIGSHVQAVLGAGVRTDFERVAEIERGARGKYFTAISEALEAVPA